MEYAHRYLEALDVAPRASSGATTQLGSRYSSAWSVTTAAQARATGCSAVRPLLSFSDISAPLFSRNFRPSGLPARAATCEGQSLSDTLQGPTALCWSRISTTSLCHHSQRCVEISIAIRCETNHSDDRVCRLPPNTGRSTEKGVRERCVRFAPRCVRRHSRSLKAKPRAPSTASSPFGTGIFLCSVQAM